MTKITTATPRARWSPSGSVYGGPDGRAGSAGGGIAAVGMAQASGWINDGLIFSAGSSACCPGALVGMAWRTATGAGILLGSVLLTCLYILAGHRASMELPDLLLARLLTGVGLGAALPNLIALTSKPLAHASGQWA